MLKWKKIIMQPVENDRYDVWTIDIWCLPVFKSVFSTEYMEIS